MTAGLLGAQYIGITAGGAEDYLKDGDQVALVQDALVLENLINQLAASFSGRKDEPAKDASEKSGSEESK
jgi:phospholipid/cholesterol/gamma-HCH transport system substrate-binding protein